MPRLLDIAQRAGVSISTVSRVLNDAPDARVTEGVRARILSTAAELGYRANHFGQALRRGRGSHVTVCVRSQDSHFSARRATAIPRAAAAVCDPVLTIDGAHLQPAHERVLELLLSQLPETAIFVGGGWRSPEIAEVVRELRERDVHCVLVDLQEDVDPELPCDSVRADRTQGSALAVAHLVEQGHRHIGLVSSRNTRGRHEGYERALTEAGITERYSAPVDPYGYGEVHRIERVREATYTLMQRHPDVTALFCATDVVAVASLKALQDLGLRVPEDVAVAGFDNDVWSGCLSVPLTSVEHPLDDMCDVVQETLRARLARPDDPWCRLVLDYRLIARESTGVISVPGGGGEA